MPPTNLDVFFRPHGVAVIGASRDPQKLGHGVVRNLVDYGYNGPIYPINPQATEIYNLRAYPSILEAPDPLDLAILVVPAPLVPAELELCGKRGIKAAIVISGGFREVGPEGAAREAEVVRICRQYGIRLLGPNGIGSIDTHTPLNTTFVKGTPPPGDIAFLSQSGAVCAAVIDWARGAGVGFSRLVSLGNQADINEAEMLVAIGRDEQTRVITAYIEGISDGPAFVAAAEVARRLPIITLKAGRGAGGAKAVASHTGALAGRAEAYDAAFRRAGVLRASTMEELFDWGRAMAWQPLPRGNRVAILTNSGGPGILAVDALEAAGMQLAPLTDETKAFIRKRVPAAASVQNPVDILAGPGPGTYALCLDALLSDPTVDAVVAITAPQDWFAPLSLAEVIGEFTGRGKPILAVIMGLASVSDATAVLHRRRVPNFAFPERVGSTLAAMWRRKQWLDAVNNQPDAPSRPANCNQAAAQALLDAAPANGWLLPEQVEALLRAYGLRTPGAGIADSAEAAVALAEEVGYPVVLKLAARGVIHKSEVGGVALDLPDAEAVRSAFAQMMARARAEGVPDEAISGVLVQKMIPAGIDLIVGVVRDAQFGPLVMAGVGGVQVELLRDVTFELAPLTPTQAESMLDRTSAGRLLAGFRGAPPADRAAVVDVIVRLAQLAHDHPALAEVEINPLMVMPQGGGAWAVDARARVAQAGTRDQR
ncbi:MAG: acetate--CoA ligase family protein [Aggregatilineaceae bacterium]